MRLIRNSHEPHRATSILSAGILACSGSIFPAAASLPVSGVKAGGLIFNRAFAPEDSPVWLTNNTTLSNVTFMPGTTVYVQSNFIIRAAGPVRAVGTSNAPVRFASAQDNVEGWQGFLFEDTAPGSEFDFCVIEGARNSALRLIRSTPLIRNTVFTNNYGPSGGAVYAELTQGSLLISNCTFIANQAVNDGGAVWISTGAGRADFVRCAFTGNVANPSYQTRHTYGGAVAANGNVRMTRCDFHGNRAHAYTIYARYGVYVQGGALWAGDGEFDIAACEFTDNACEMSAHGFTPDPSFPFGGAVAQGGGTIRIRNSLFVDNWLTAQRGQERRGSAVYVGGGDLKAVNCTFTGNWGAAALQNSGGTADLRGCILFFNASEITGTVSVNFCNVQGGFEGEGNLAYNPIFDEHYRIIPGSPAIDAGDPDATHNDASFPPSQGTLRNDLGLTGGPDASLWLDTPDPAPQATLKVELGHIVFWIDQPDVQLESAATIQGPWYRYDGQLLTIGTRRAVVLNPMDPRRFFRLAR